MFRDKFILTEVGYKNKFGRVGCIGGVLPLLMVICDLGKSDRDLFVSGPKWNRTLVMMSRYLALSSVLTQFFVGNV